MGHWRVIGEVFSQSTRADATGTGTWRGINPSTCDRDRSPAFLWWGAVPLWVRLVIVLGRLLLFLMLLGVVARL